MKGTYIFKIIAAAFFAVIALISCSKMDDTYNEFLGYGQAKYPGKADSVKVLSGNNRMILTWLNSADPKVTRAKVYWNNRADSLDVPINNTMDSIIIPFNNAAEGTYVFEIYTFDTDGNRSVRVEAIGRVFGPTYQSRLLSRPIYDATVVNDSLWINWGGLSDTAIVGTQVTYKDANNVTRSFMVDEAELLSQFPDFPRGDIQYRTIYLPDVNAIDTFYTPWVSMYVKGMRFPLPKTGWTVTASSFDSRAGANYRPPTNLIDNNPATIWVNQINPATTYPHWAAIDMQSVYNIEGIIIQQRNAATALARDVELYTSLDGVNWTFQTRATLENRASAEFFIDLPAATNARHIKVIALSAFSGTENNIAMAELGAYIR